jgi:hypothetical protein
MSRPSRGCLASFVLATLLAGCVADPYYSRRYGAGYDDEYYDDRGYDDRGYDDDDRRGRHHGDHRDRDRDHPTIVCASKDGRPARCHTDFRIKSAEIDKRYSGSPCDYGRSWGFDSNEVWVDRGCRARFRLYPAGRWR